MDFNNYNEFNEDLRGNLINNFEFNIKNDVTDVLLTDPILFKYTAIDYGLLELNGLYDFFRQLLITYNYEEISYWRDISSIDTFVL